MVDGSLVRELIDGFVEAFGQSKAGEVRVQRESRTGAGLEFCGNGLCRFVAVSGGDGSCQCRLCFVWTVRLSGSEEAVLLRVCNLWSVSDGVLVQ